jgi:hypothetical protein
VVTPADPERGLTVTVPAGMGFPPVFYQQGSAVGAELRAFVVHQGYTAGYHWDYLSTAGAGAGEGASTGGTEERNNVRTGDSHTSNSGVYRYVVPLGLLLVIVASAVTWHFARTVLPRKAPIFVDVGLHSGSAGERLLASDHTAL